MRSRTPLQVACALMLGVLLESPASTEATDLVRIRLVVADAGGNPLTSVPVGAAFELRGYIQDIRTNGADGVFAAYLDVLYDSSLAAFQGPITWGPAYLFGRSPEDPIVPGIIDEVGAFDGLSPLGSDEYLLFTAPFQAAAPGTALFVAGPADESPSHDVLMFGQDEPVCPSVNACVGSTILVDASVVITGCSAADGADEVLENDTILATVIVEVCDWISAGNNLEVMGPEGHLVLRAGNSVELRNDFSVGVDGRLTVEIDSSLVP